MFAMRLVLCFSFIAVPPARESRQRRNRAHPASVRAGEIRRSLPRCGRGRRDGPRWCARAPQEDSIAATLGRPRSRRCRPRRTAVRQSPGRHLSSAHAFICTCTASAWRSSVCPNDVSATPRGRRSNSFTPNSSSRSFMLLVRVGCAILRSAAASEMFLRCATRRKYSSWRRSITIAYPTDRISFAQGANITIPGWRRRASDELLPVADQFPLRIDDQ